MLTTTAIGPIALLSPPQTHSPGFSSEGDVSTELDSCAPQCGTLPACAAPLSNKARRASEAAHALRTVVTLCREARFCVPLGRTPSSSGFLVPCRTPAGGFHLLAREEPARARWRIRGSRIEGTVFTPAPGLRRFRPGGMFNVTH